LKPELEAVGLIALLIVVTFALGVEFGVSGLPGALGGSGPPAGGRTSLAAGPPPEFVLRAEGINPNDLYASASYKVVPPYMMVPLVGLQAKLLSAGREITSHFGRLPSITLITNASGLASSPLPQGQYEVDISGSNFAANTFITMANNTISTLNFTLGPSAREVTALKVVSDDSDTGLEPTSRLYALLNCTSAPSNGFSELVGFEGVSSGHWVSGNVFYLNQSSGHPVSVNVFSLNQTSYGGPQTSLNATLVGSYQGTHGYWATLMPSRAYADYPSVSVMLFQYTPILEVNYTAG